MGILSAIIDDAIDNAPFNGAIRYSPPNRHTQNCPICGSKVDKKDIDSHIFNTHRHGLLLRSADGDSKFRDAVRDQRVLTTQQSTDCLEFCHQSLALYARGDIDWGEEKRLSLTGESNSSIVKMAFVQLLYLIYSEDKYHELSFRRYQDLKSIYPRLRLLPGSLGVAARTVIEIYFDWYECISSSRGPFFSVASLFQPSRVANPRSPNESTEVIYRTISICAPNQMIRFINLASKAVHTRPEDYPEKRLLIAEATNFYQSCPSIYKPKAYFLASFVNFKFSTSIALDISDTTQARLVDAYGIDDARA
jgi:hypothetical protein